MKQTASDAEGLLTPLSEHGGKRHAIACAHPIITFRLSRRISVSLFGMGRTDFFDAEVPYAANTEFKYQP